MDPLSKNDLIQIYDELPEEAQKKISEKLKSYHEKASGESLRSKKNWGRNQDHKVVGQLFFEYGDDEGKPIPIHNMYLELWDRDSGNPDDFLGQGRTDREGRFEIWYDPRDAGKFDLPDLDLRIYESHHRFDKLGNVSSQRKLIYTVTGDKNVTEKEYDFGVCKLPYWEYDKSAATPRVLITDEGDPPQSYGPGRSLVMVKTLAGIELKKRLHITGSKRMSIDKVQVDYPENLTRKLEKENPGITRTDEFFGDMMLNGMASNIMDKHPSRPNCFWVHYHWNSYEQDGEYAMPNVDILLERSGVSVKPVEIGLALRKPGATEPNAPVEMITVKPGDHKWNAAKRLARVSATLAAELDNHLGHTHLNVEQYAIAGYRNFRLNPIKFLLFPHVKEVSLINNSANNLLLGDKGYITKATAFTASSLNEHIHQVVATLDWKGWKPRRIACERHTFAKASILFWNVLGEYIDWFFEQYDEGIRNHWFEVFKFSDDLVVNSTEYFLCGYLTQNLDPNEDENYWFDWNERMKLTFPRAKHNGKEKSVSRVTEVSENPSEQDIANLKQVCRYVIHHATFMHWWSNSKQYDEGGELRFNALGLRYGENGVFTGEDDDTILPPPEDATMQLWISYMLSNANIGFILKNEERDIHPKMIEILKKYKEEFKELGVDISKIPSRTNI